jgi:Fic-DOC domain mobile mystery protein B
MSEWEARPGETPIDISHLKAKGVQTRSQLERIEAANVLKAVYKYFGRRRPTVQMAPFTLPWVKRLHREMLGEVWKHAGEFRTCDLNIGVKWQHIIEKLQNLLDDLSYWEQSGVDVFEQALLLHHKAVWIHPFHDGNGRWARLLADILLHMRGHSVPVWPADLVGTTSPARAQYLAAIKAADDGDYEPLKCLYLVYMPTPLRPMTVRRTGQRPRPGKVTIPKLPPPDEEPGETKTPRG